MLKSINLNVFVNLHVTLRILATIPATTCECDRTRTTMVSKCLNRLALMYIHIEIVPEVNKVLSKFTKDKRRLELILIFPLYSCQFRTK